MSQSIRYPIQLVRASNRQWVDAYLESMNEKHLEDFEQHWKPTLIGSTEEDQYWDWERKNRIYGTRIGTQAYAIECFEMTQGLMLIETLGHRSWFEPHRRIVYVHSLATAPWNRTPIQDPPEYRLVGSVLLEFAQYQSVELGYGGLVGLHSLPGSEQFYRRLNMVECGPDAENDDLIYFEWYRRQATEREGWDDLIDS